MKKEKKRAKNSKAQQHLDQCWLDTSSFSLLSRNNDFSWSHMTIYLNKCYQCYQYSETTFRLHNATSSCLVKHYFSCSGTCHVSWQASKSRLANLHIDFTMYGRIKVTRIPINTRCKCKDRCYCPDNVSQIYLFWECKAIGAWVLENFHIATGDS